MKKRVKIGIIICDRYHNCAGGKCFRALRERAGAFGMYAADTDVEIVGYTSCGGCPGGNIEYANGEMIKNGAEVVHLATGFLVGYPPCPYINYFRDFIQSKYGLRVVVGTHPIPEKYLITHTQLNTWAGEEWGPLLEATMADRETRLAYD